MLVILGPTASGKTRLAAHLAHRLGGEVVSADSRQVYRGMDIGTGKDLEDYWIDNQLVAYHLVDILEAGESYNVNRYQQDCNAAIADIVRRDKLPILCGGTGFYIEAVLKNHQFTSIPVNTTLREELETKTDQELRQLFAQTPSEYSTLADISTRKRTIRAIEIAQYLRLTPSSGQPQTAPNRLKLPTSIYGLNLPVEIRRERITARLRSRLQNGMIEEVAGLLARGIPAEQLIFYGLEYKFLTQYVQGLLDYDSMFDQLNVAIHQFAKRQMTFFRKMERDGLAIRWLDAQQPVAVLVEEICSLQRY
jgi:tRNA dimethylallyltransferase